MWISKQLILSLLRQVNELERRVKRLELMELGNAENKIASLRNEEAGTVKESGLSTIEEIINETIKV